MRRRTVCKHYTGTVALGAPPDDVCRAGVRYRDVAAGGPEGWAGGAVTLRSLPCLSKCDTCPRRELPTAEEVRADLLAMDAEADRFTDCLQRGVSRCCEAPLDESAVIRRPGHRHDGHGPRYCSKCRKLAFMV